MNKLVLVILDWFWINEKTPKENAIKQANTSTFDKLFKADYASLGAHWKFVWVPDDQMWNSEVWHLTIWSGRIIKNSIVTIDEMLDNGEFEKIKTFKKWIEHCKKNWSNLHLLQIFGPWGVHWSDSHLKKMLKIIPSDIGVFLHLFGDWRDLAPNSMLELMKDFEVFLEQYPNVKISSLAWRYYGMDRDNNRERIQKAYDEIIFWENETSDTPSEYIAKSYENLITDEFIKPVSFMGMEKVSNWDTVFFLNFRSDRWKQITQAFTHSLNVEKKNNTFSFITKNLDDVYFATMTKYYPNYRLNIFIENDEIKNTLWKVISNHELRQLHLAETEKFAHVTKFFNGDQQIVYDWEKDILVPSHKVATYDLDPEMSAQEIYNEFEKNANDYDFVVMNFANWDMIGHTWVMDASIKAIEKLDELVEKIIKFCDKNNFELLITADHGNCDEMWTIENPKTAHTLNPVPCRYIKKNIIQKIKKNWWLADIAPTALKIMWISIPKEMTGEVLI